MGHHSFIMDNFMGGFGLFWLIWVLIWIVAIVFLIGIIVYAIRRNNVRSQGPKEYAIRILQERFARGEIDELEYKEKKRILEED